MLLPVKRKVMKVEQKACVVEQKDVSLCHNNCQTQTQEKMNGCINLTPEQIETITTNLLGNRTHGIRDAVLFILGTRTGFRISELLSLKVSSVKFGQNSGTIEVAKSNTKGKVAGRVIPITTETQDLIKLLIDDEQLTSNDFLFRSQQTGKAIVRSQAHMIIKKACASLEITGKVATHSMRKTFAANVYERSGESLQVTQTALGHVNINNTIKYLQCDREKVSSVILSL